MRVETPNWNRFFLVFLSLVVLCASKTMQAQSTQDTKVIPANDPLITWNGAITDTTIGGEAARNLRAAGTTATFLTFYTNRAILRLYATTPTPIHVSIRYVGSAAIVPPVLNQWVNVDIPFFDGTDTSRKIVTLSTLGIPGASNNGLYVSANQMLTLYSPKRTPSIVGLNAMDMSGIVPVSPTLFTPEVGTLKFASQDGYPTLLTPNPTRYVSGSIRFRVKVNTTNTLLLARVLIFIRQAWQATVDGVPQTVAYTPFGVTVGGTSYYTYGWIPVASNLSQGEHEILLSNVTPPQNFGDLPPYLFPALTDIQLTDGQTGSGSVLSNTYTPRKVLMAMGHSIVAGRWLQDATKSYTHLLAQPQNMAIANRGVSGCTFLNYSGQGVTDPLYTAQSVEGRTKEVADLKPDVLIVDAFVNDLQRRNAPGMSLLYYNKDPQKPTLESRLKTFLLSVQAANPSTRIFVLGVQSTTVAPVADISELNTRLSAVVNNLNNPNCRYIAPCPGFNPTTHTNDGLHPNAAGSQVLAEYLKGFLFGKQ